MVLAMSFQEEIYLDCLEFLLDMDKPVAEGYQILVLVLSSTVVTTQRENEFVRETIVQVVEQ